MIDAGLDTGKLGFPAAQFVPSSYVSSSIMSCSLRWQLCRSSRSVEGGKTVSTLSALGQHRG